MATPFEQLLHGFLGVANVLQRSKEQKLEDVYRTRLMKKWEEEQARGKRPVSDFFSPGPSEMVNKPEAVAPAFSPDLPSGFEAPSETPVTQAGPPAWDFQKALGNARFEDLPSILGIETAMTKEKEALKGFGPDQDIYQGTKKIKSGVPTVKAPAHKVEKIYDEQAGKSYEQSYDWDQVSGTWKVAGERRLIGEKEDKAPTRKSEDEFDEKSGKTYRQDYEWKGGKWNKVGLRRAVSGPAPEKPKMTKEHVDKLFSDYNIARLKAPSDPIRLQMVTTLRTMGIDVPVSLPELSRQDFEGYIGSGKLPQKPVEKTAKERAKEWLQANAPEYPLSEANIEAVIKKQGFK